MFAPKVRIIVLSDSCHSGTITRDRPKSIDPLPSRRMPAQRAKEVYEAHQKLYDGIQRKIPSRDAKSIKASVVLISGCQDNQTSGDGDRNGRFTGQLKTVWNNGSFDGPLPQLHKAILTGMPPFQTPNYYTIGARDTTLTRSRPSTSEPGGKPAIVFTSINARLIWREHDSRDGRPIRCTTSPPVRSHHHLIRARHGRRKCRVA